MRLVVREPCLSCEPSVRAAVYLTFPTAITLYVASSLEPTCPMTATTYSPVHAAGLRYTTTLIAVICRRISLGHTAGKIIKDMICTK